MTQAAGHIRPDSIKKQSKPTRPAKSGRSSITHVTKDGIGEVPRPAGTSRSAFGLVVTGDCLSPKVKNGQVVIVDKGLPKPGELAVVWAKGCAMPQVKILAAAIAGFPHHPESTVCCGIELQQLNPPRRFRIWADRVEKIIEAVIGHMKAEGHLGRCYLKGHHGDAANVVLTAVGHNLRLVLAWLRILLRLILSALSQASAVPPALRSAS